MLTDETRDALRQFCKVIDEIHACRFIKQAKTQDHTITISRIPSVNRVPQYDRDDFRSFATLFRKLVANREPTQLFRIMNIIKPFCPVEHQGSFKEIKAELNREAEQPPIGIAIGRMGEEINYTPKFICDVFFNGMIFHSDPHLQDDVARILDFEPFVMVAFLRYTSIVVNVATKYAYVIEHHNFFQNE